MLVKLVWLLGALAITWNIVVRDWQAVYECVIALLMLAVVVRLSNIRRRLYGRR